MRPIMESRGDQDAIDPRRPQRQQVIEVSHSPARDQLEPFKAVLPGEAPVEVRRPPTDPHGGEIEQDHALDSR